jgi:hypothetical protein
VIDAAPSVAQHELLLPAGSGAEHTRAATLVRMIIQRQCQPLSAIELLFEGVTRLSVLPPPAYYG